MCSYSFFFLFCFFFLSSAPEEVKRVFSLQNANQVIIINYNMKVIVFSYWICVIIWSIHFWTVISSIYWKLRKVNCFYCNPTLAVLSTYTPNQNHKQCFFSPVREMICPIKSICEFRSKIPYGINILVFVS